MEKKIKIQLSVCLIALATLMAAGIGIAYYGLFVSPFKLKASTYIYIDRDDTADSVHHKIVNAGQPSQLWAWDWQARHSDYAKHIKTGCYVLKGTDNLRELFVRLSRGHQSPIELVVPSARTVEKLAEAVGKQLMIDEEEILTLLNDTAYLDSLGWNKQTLPALLIPNTYEVYWNMSARRWMQRMKKEHKAYWNTARLNKAKALGLTPVEVATLASIVEEETAYVPEMPMVAGLYLNRLKRGMLLQADPTVKFSLQQFDLQRILYKHLEVDSPYNTYKHAGLPPGPIRIPSTKGLESVLNYAQHNYLYMCAKETLDGTHNFATNSAQHGRNARKYQQALNRRKIYK